MNIWRLISFHEKERKQQVAQRFIEGGHIAIGWGKIGDLRQYSSKAAIGEAIRAHYGDTKNSHLGGPTLWHMNTGVQVSDLIIIDAQKSWHKVVEVCGEYEWNNVEPNVTSTSDYYHQRSIKLRDDIDAAQLLKIIGTKPGLNENPRSILFYYGSFIRSLEPSK